MAEDVLVPHEVLIRFQEGHWPPVTPGAIPRGAHVILQRASVDENGVVTHLSRPDDPIPLHKLDGGMASLMGEYFPHALAACQAALDATEADRARLASELSDAVAKVKALEEQLARMRQEQPQRPFLRARRQVDAAIQDALAKARTAQ